MAKNGNLTAARKTKNDEFYTQFSDIEKELTYYHEQLHNKIIYCNCDDPEKSNFWRYFYQNFDNIGIKALIATHYNPTNPSYKLEVWRDKDGNRLEPVRTNLKQNGDFRSDECIELLKIADVVVTNPPFSLAREYIAQLIEFKKQFIIICNMNSITYKEIFPLLKDNKMWIGYTNPKHFLQPNGKLKSFGNVLWYTNVDIKKRHQPLTLTKQYCKNPELYPKYVNYDAIECARVNNIPMDYFGCIGVPITFLYKYCPEQFEIVGISSQLGCRMSEIAKKGTYEEGGIRFYLHNQNCHQQLKLYTRLYDRIVIRRRQ